MGIKNQKDWDPNWDEKWCTQEDLKSLDDEIVCTCWGTTIKDVKILSSEHETIESAVNSSGIGTSCGMCLNRFEYLFEEIRKSIKLKKEQGGND